MKVSCTHHNRFEEGFTLIEVILTLVVIGTLIGIILPRAQRAKVDAKYIGVRQAGVEIGRWGMDWATRNLESQDPGASCNLNSYVATLEGFVGDVDTPNWTRPKGQAIANDPLTTACNRDPGINNVVADLIPADSQPKNPFNGASYFGTGGANDGSKASAGQLYLGSVFIEKAQHYYFVYSGTGSDKNDQWYAGMGDDTNFTYAELRNGIFMARLVPVN